MKQYLIGALAALGAAFTVPAVADSFLPPTIQHVRSASGETVATIIPARLSCALNEADCEPAARAIIYTERGGYTHGGRTIRLRNQEAPGQVLVTDDAERLLTINDYAAYGFGDNVLVVYDEEGEVVAHYGLADFLPEDYIAGLPRTASTLRWWGAEHRIEPGTHRAVISLFRAEGVPENGVPPTAHIPFFELSLDLDTGELERPSGPAWENALNCARGNSWLVPDRAAERERERYRRLCR